MRLVRFSGRVYPKLDRLKPEKGRIFHKPARMPGVVVGVLYTQTGLGVGGVILRPVIRGHTPQFVKVFRLPVGSQSDIGIMLVVDIHVLHPVHEDNESQIRYNRDRY